MNFNEYFEKIATDAADEAVCDTLNTVLDLSDVAEDVLLEVLSEEGATHTEYALAQYAVGRFKEILADLIIDHYEFEDCEDVCDGDCENCYIEVFE